MSSRKFWTIFILIAVFVVGMIAGVLLDENVLDKMQKRRPRRGGSSRTPAPYYSLEIMAKELSLSEDQKAQIHDEVFRKSNERLRLYKREMDARFRELRDQLISEIKAVLDIEQKLKFEAMIEKYNTERKKAYEERKKHAQEAVKKKGEKK